jgi:uncharacterized membrane protein
MTGLCAVVFLGLTQMGLAGVLFYRLLVLGQSDSEVLDIQALLLFSIFGYIALRLYLGGILPVITWRSAVLSYAGLVALVAGACLIWFGFPPLSQWATTWLPAIVGPAIIVGLYALFAYLGHRRFERELAD